MLPLHPIAGAPLLSNLWLMLVMLFACAGVGFGAYYLGRRS